LWLQAVEVRRNKYDWSGRPRQSGGDRMSTPHELLHEELNRRSDALVNAIDVVIKDTVLTVSETVTGISVQNERGTNQIGVQFLEGEHIKHSLTLPVDAARMLMKALKTMTILDEEESK